ncbi:MAG: hypothetical protein QXM86_02750 [Candidatus Bathyarchaeia archaeon]
MVAEEEISWEEAFSYAVRFVIYVILWVIVGRIIQWVGTGITLLSPSWWIGGIIFTYIGYIIMLLGIMAAYVKLMWKLIREATSTPSSSSPPS